MNRIDIVGVGGVGKSTLVKNLRSLRRKKSWLDETEAFNLAAGQALKSANYSKVINLFLSLLSYTSIKLPNTFLLQISMKMGGGLYKEFLEKHPTFLQAIAKGIERAGSNNIQKLDFIHHFVHVLQKLSFIDHYLKKTRWVIWDESLTHKMFAVIPWEESSLDLVKLYSESLPLPDGVIYLRDRADKVAEKIMKRSLSGITISAHANMDTDALIKLNLITNQLVEASVDIMKARGVEILELDAQDRNGNNVVKAQEFVDSIIAARSLL